MAIPRLNQNRAALVLLVFFSVGLFAAGIVINNLQPFSDPAGKIATYNTAGSINEGTTTFFQILGTNGRTCGTCHVPQEAMSFTAADAQSRFTASNGTDPLFAAVDGANCPTATTGDPDGHSLIINNGLIRIALKVPANAEFTITAVSDPYGCALVTDPNSGLHTVSVYRRPLPASNLNFLSTVMFDGRETVQPLNNGSTFAANLVTDLKHQALDATLGHAQASTPPSDSQLSSIVSFELGLSTAQIQDNVAGSLYVNGATGGPANLSSQTYYPGINDSLGGDPSGATFNPSAFTLYTAWETATDGRAAIAAGEKLFNTLPLTITAVRGLNDNPALGNPASIQGTCTTCHDTPNVGNHSLPVPLDIGTSHAAGFETNTTISGGLANLSVPNLPIFKVTGCSDPVSGKKVVFYTTDPGKALISGKCNDVNRIKGPILRGLAARAPYFHNGAAATLNEVVNFYDDRFKIGLTDQEKAELVAFLNSL